VSAEQRTLREVFETIRRDARRANIFLTAARTGVAVQFTAQIAHVGDDFIELHDPRVTIPFAAIAYVSLAPA